MGLKLVGEVVFLDLGRGEYFTAGSLELLVDSKENKPTAIFTVGIQFYADHHSMLYCPTLPLLAPYTGARSQSPAEYDPSPSTLANGHPVSTSSELRIFSVAHCHGGF